MTYEAYSSKSNISARRHLVNLRTIPVHRPSYIISFPSTVINDEVIVSVILAQREFARIARDVVEAIAGHVAPELPAALADRFLSHEVPEHRLRALDCRRFSRESRQDIHPVTLGRQRAAARGKARCGQVERGHHFIDHLPQLGGGSIYIDCVAC